MHALSAWTKLQRLRCDLAFAQLLSFEMKRPVIPHPTAGAQAKLAEQIGDGQLFARNRSSSHFGVRRGCGGLPTVRG